jgi:transposase
MRKVDEIRQKYREGNSINAIANACKCSWETVKRIISLSDEEVDQQRKMVCGENTIITKEVEAAVIEILDTENALNIKKKQRKTATVIFKTLRASGVYTGSIRSMQMLVKKLKQERGIQKVESYLPLEFALGSVFQVDHGEVDLIIDGKRCKGYQFVTSIPGYVIRYCQIFPTKNSEAWGEFHERSFRFFGGVPQSAMYDNDSVLMDILKKERHQTHFSHQLEAHYGFSSRFCNLASGNEKGGVENAVGYCRRNFLSGRPEFASWELANQHLDAASREDIKMGRHYKDGRPLQEIYDELQKKLEPLPPEYSWCRKVEAKVNSVQLVTVDKHSYSVPRQYVGRYVQVNLSVLTATILSSHAVIAKHSRSFEESSISYDIYHYLEQLRENPGALWDCQPIKRHAFHQQFLELRARLERQYSQREANKKFIDILSLAQVHSKETLLLKALTIALERHTITPACISSLIAQLGVQESLDGCAYTPIEGWECNTQQYGALNREGFDCTMKEVSHA